MFFVSVSSASVCSQCILRFGHFQPYGLIEKVLIKLSVYVSDIAFITINRKTNYLVHDFVHFHHPREYS